MVAPRLPPDAVHALLHHRPMAIIGDKEPVQIEVEAVLHGGTIHLGHQPAGARQRLSVETNPLADGRQLGRRAPGVLAAPAANVNAEFVLQGS